MLAAPLACFDALALKLLQCVLSAVLVDGHQTSRSISDALGLSPDCEPLIEATVQSLCAAKLIRLRRGGMTVTERGAMLIRALEHSAVHGDPVLN